MQIVNLLKFRLKITSIVLFSIMVCLSFTQFPAIQLNNVNSNQMNISSQKIETVDLFLSDQTVETNFETIIKPTL